MTYDKEFLLKLDANREKETFARIVALSFQEEPIELIEGRVTQGSINIDGSSAVRRTCSLTLTAQELNINEFLWGVKTKFKLEIGLRNTIDSSYPDIIWFPQGIFVIASFNVSHTANNYTINISGKDKMCLLNGDLGGSLIASVDFGVEEYYDKENNTIIYTPIPIPRILREAVHTYGGEPYHNIEINDLDEIAVELLEYRGDAYMYFFYNTESSEFTGFTMNGEMPCFLKGEPTTLRQIPESSLNTMIQNGTAKIGDIVTFSDSPIEYTIARLEYGDTAGYRLTDLTYAGDLISSIGESLTSIIDKIVNMLGNYEYFYDLDGKFIFQRKKDYVSTVWNNIISSEEGDYATDAKFESRFSYEFRGNNLISSFSNQPNIQNLKNDYSVWGNRKSVSDVDIPIHYRYAIDRKPTLYKRIEVTADDIAGYNAKHPDTPMKVQHFETEEEATFTAANYDWRELIYCMAADYYAYGQLDSFLAKVATANPHYPTGRTGYEQYYVDMFSFWRELYNPQPEPEWTLYASKEKLTFVEEKKELSTKGHYVKVDDISTIEDRSTLYAMLTFKDENSKWYELHPLLDAIPINYEDSFVIEAESGTTKFSNEFYIPGPTGYIPVNSRIKNITHKEELYVQLENEVYVKLINADGYIPDDFLIYQFSDDNEYYLVSEMDANIKTLYLADENTYNITMSRTPLDISGSRKEDGEWIGNASESGTKQPQTFYNQYYYQEHKYVVDTSDVDKKYWSTAVSTAPESLNFWFDFLDAGGELDQFSIPAIGDRAKVVNDNTVTAIYFREVPNIIFATREDWNNRDNDSFISGYTPVIVQSGLENLFTISSQFKSAKDKLDELIYNHSYCIESVTIQSVPIYYLEPNTRILVQDERSKVNGEYIVSKLTIPLAYNGMMSITATKAPTRIY